MEERDISKEEIRLIISKIKEGKAAGLDGLPGEIWKYGGEEMVEWHGVFVTKFGKGRGGRRDGKKEE